MTHFEKTSSKTKTKKNYKEKESEAMHGKRRFRLRKTLEKEGKELVREFKDAT
jgi:hypothetical protein